MALGNYLVVGEKKNRPAVSVGMGIDRVGGSDPAGFAVASKNFGPKRHPMAAHFGLAVREAMSMAKDPPTEVVEVGGLTGQVARNLNASVMWDGGEWHAGLQTRWKKIGIAVLAVKMEHPGFIVGRSWQIRKPDREEQHHGEAEHDG